MRVTLDYGKTGLDVELPAERVVGPLSIQPAAPLADPVDALNRALANPIGTPPLAQLAKGRKDACILVCDITRPVPNKTIAEAMLPILEGAGIARDQIFFLVATGMHRPSTEAERLEMEDLVGRRVELQGTIGDRRPPVLVVDAPELVRVLP